MNATIFQIIKKISWKNGWWAGNLQNVEGEENCDAAVSW